MSALAACSPPVLFLDTETTGLDHAAHELVQVGLIDEHGHVLLDCLVNPGRPIPPEAVAVHGITDDMASQGLPPNVVRELVRSLVRGRDLVIYPAAFESKFVPVQGAASVMCAMEAAQDFWGLDRWPRLSWCASELGIEQPEPHTAIGDCQVTRQVWAYMHEAIAHG